MATLQDVIKRARDDRKWGLREAARQTGLHNAHLFQIEKGIIARPDPNILFTLATVYDLDYDALLRLAGHIQPGQVPERPSPYGAVAWKVLSELDTDEQREVVEFMSEIKRRGQGDNADE